MSGELEGPMTGAAAGDQQLLDEVRRKLNREAINLVLKRCQSSQKGLSAFIETEIGIVDLGRSSGIED